MSTDSPPAVDPEALERKLSSLGLSRNLAKDRVDSWLAEGILRDADGPPPVDRKALAEWLRSIHFDGTGCGTSGTGGCSNCYGPSPMDAYDLADAILSSGILRDADEVRREAKREALAELPRYAASGVKSDAELRAAVHTPATEALDALDQGKLGSVRIRLEAIRDATGGAD